MVFGGKFENSRGKNLGVNLRHLLDYYVDLTGDCILCHKPRGGETKKRVEANRSPFLIFRKAENGGQRPYVLTPRKKI